eukprot:1189676-Prorocentrum_minimum.AAC.4
MYATVTSTTPLNLSKSSMLPIDHTAKWALFYLPFIPCVTSCVPLLKRETVGIFTRNCELE